MINYKFKFLKSVTYLDKMRLIIYCIMPILVSCSSEGRAGSDIDKVAPAALIAPPTVNEVYYTVLLGDDIWKISKKFNVTLKWLIKRNGISDDSDIFPGKIMVVPKN